MLSSAPHCCERVTSQDVPGLARDDFIASDDFVSSFSRIHPGTNDRVKRCGGCGDGTISVGHPQDREERDGRPCVRTGEEDHVAWTSAVPPMGSVHPTELRCGRNGPTECGGRGLSWR